MATRTIVQYVDDLDGGEAAGTVLFGLDGRNYEIDLSDDNEAKLRELLEPFLKAGRRAGGTAAKVGRQASRGTSSRGPGNAYGVDPQEARAWAREHGFEVNDRGRVPAPVLEAFQKAHA